jgi:fatty acid-binding protein DegV
MNYEIITDSSANLTDEQIDKYGIQIISLLFRVGEREYYSYTKGERQTSNSFTV